MSPRSYKIILAVLGVVSLVLVPFLVLGALPTAVGTIALVAVVAWVLFGATNSMFARSSSRQ
ncbi:hypothetical protein [Curtobacterium sp. UCD-KPL2560]|uniref:hypothetical protein n=1 Tax=Curtobacterium sp. UCD-KPL2560 TaxID=1885315 RepID=UPI000826F6B5|nr:hypothetical protein [Curtobacterium sp. UCD-KPL2560]